MDHNHVTDNKVKDFKKSVKRLITYLKEYNYLNGYIFHSI